MDVLSKTDRSAVMRKVKSHGTKSELALMRLLESMKLRFRAQPEDIPGKPDFILPRLKLLIFMDGCFWHGCPACCRMPADHREYWVNKITRNGERDRRTTHQLRRAGWSVLRIWEHELKAPDDLKKRIHIACATRRRRLAR